MKWESVPHNMTDVNLHSENSKFQIMKTKQGKYRLIAFDHDASDQFPQAEFWVKDFNSLQEAAKQAEMM
jgi:hypothetical protein